MSKTVKIKRRIERVRSRINVTLASGVGIILLHTAEDAKTFVRTIISLTIGASVSAGAQLEYAGVVQLKPAGVTVVVPAVTADLDRPFPNNVIWENVGNIRNHTLIGDANTDRWFADLKSMRKMKENDTLTYDIATLDAVTLNGTIVMFFKE